MTSMRAEIMRNFPRPSSPQLGRMAWGSFISSLGSTFQVFAFTYVVYATTKSALATVMVGVSFAVAFGVLALPAGTIAKRFDHRRIVAIVSIAKALIYAAILALQLTDKLSVTAILISSAASGATSAIQYPCWQQLLQQFSAKGQLDESDALFYSLSSITSVAGALVGGALLDAVGPAPLFAFNVLSYVPLAFIVVRLPDETGANATSKVKEASASLKMVLSTITGSRAVRMAVIFTALLELLAWPLVSLLPKIASEVGSAAKVYGLLLASFYAGAALVAVLLRRWKERERYSRIIRFSAFASGGALVIAGIVGIAPLGTALTLAGLSIVLAAAGLGLATAQAVLSAITQLGVPKKIEGEVLGMFALITIFFGTIGASAEGYLADLLDVWWLPLASGALVVVIVIRIRLRRGFQVLNDAQPKSAAGLKHVKRHARSRHSTEGRLTVVAHIRKPLSVGTDENGVSDEDRFKA